MDRADRTPALQGPEPAVGWKSRVWTATKAVVSIALIVWMVHLLDMQKLVDALATMNLWFVLSAGVLVALQIVVAGLRWNLVLHAVGRRLRSVTAIRLTWIAAFFNSYTPGGVAGDAVRFWYASDGGRQFAAAGSAGVLDRASGLLGLIAVSAFAAVVFASANRLPGLWYLLGFGAASCVAGLTGIIMLERLPRDWERYRLVRWMGYLASATRQFIVNWPVALLVIGLAAATHVAYSIATFLLLRALDVQVGLAECLLLVPPVILLSTMPVSIGGWGVREGAMAAALAFIGVANQEAVLTSLIIGLFVAISSLPGGAFWLLSPERELFRK